VALKASDEALEKFDVATMEDTAWPRLGRASSSAHEHAGGGDFQANEFKLVKDSHIQVTCVSMTFTKYAIVRVHVSDACLYIDKNVPNFWGRNVTLEELKAAIPGNAFLLTKFDTDRGSKERMDTSVGKNLQLLRTAGAVSEERANVLQTAYREMWASAPAVHRGSIFRQDFLPEGGFKATLDGQDLGNVPGPGTEVMFAEPLLEETAANVGLSANRRNIIKNIMRGSGVTDSSPLPDVVQIYAHEDGANSVETRARS
jgi:hypothetical protein